jgi:hypothetical protein
MYSIAANTAKNSSDEPRSFCRTITRIEKPHARSSGPRCFGSGMAIPRKRRVPERSNSRFSTRYAAKKMTSSTFAASPGWKFNGPMCTQRRAPLISLPIPGSDGSTRAATPRNRHV